MAGSSSKHWLPDMTIIIIWVSHGEIFSLPYKYKIIEDKPERVSVIICKDEESAVVC